MILLGCGCSRHLIFYQAEAAESNFDDSDYNAQGRCYMTVQKGKAKNKTKKASTPKISEKIVIEAMTTLENLAKEYISQAKDEIKTGRKIADKIRDVADNIENELVLEGINMTEAYDSKDFVGVGIGVL